MFHKSFFLLGFGLFSFDWGLGRDDFLHHGTELLEIDYSILVDVNCLHDFLHHLGLFLRALLRNGSIEGLENSREFVSINGSRLVLVEHFKGLL
jgi:hypothetical protein